MKPNELIDKFREGKEWHLIIFDLQARTAIGSSLYSFIKQMSFDLPETLTYIVAENFATEQIKIKGNLKQITNRNKIEYQAIPVKEIHVDNINEVLVLFQLRSCLEQIFNVNEVYNAFVLEALPGMASLSKQEAIKYCNEHKIAIKELELKEISQELITNQKAFLMEQNAAELDIGGKNGTTEKNDTTRHIEANNGGEPN